VGDISGDAYLAGVNKYFILLSFLLVVSGTLHRMYMKFYVRIKEIQEE